MNIILDEAQVDKIRDKHTVLELDTFRIAKDQPTITAWCVLENIPIMEMAYLPNYTKLHNELMDNYKKKNWNFCEQAIEHLNGKWNGELDSFYGNLYVRILQYKQQDPGDSWDGIIDKSINGIAK